MLAMNGLEILMDKGTGVEGRWVRTAIRQPMRHGVYTVIRLRDSGYYSYDKFIWRGVWLDLGGKPKKGAEAWFEEAS